ncbi:MAG: AMP-binding protein [Rhizobiaceae bacterium]|nr:AMP-binding protein [Rhizobiaceae bacterium]
MPHHSHPVWYDPTPPAREACVARYLLDRSSGENPNAPALVFEGMPVWSWEHLAGLVRRRARGLEALGIGKGDVVAVWLPNGPDLLITWMAANYIGAIFAPINVSYRGDILQHTLNISRAAMLFAHARLAERIAGLDLPHLRTLVCDGDFVSDAPGTTTIAPSALDNFGERPERDVSVEAIDPAAIIFTSGTSGPSKGVLCSYLQLYVGSTASFGYVQAEDRCFCYMPLFHIAAIASAYIVLVRGASLAVVERFQTDRFWQQVEELGCTALCGLFNSVIPFLAKQDPARRPPRRALGQTFVAPVSDDLRALATERGFDFFTAFNMSECPMPLVSEMNPNGGGGYCGRPRTGVQCRIVDTEGNAVAPNTTGELLVKVALEGELSLGYINDPDATARSRTGGWFRTGDAFYVDEAGSYHFVDRMKDTIRRRGENISSFEVEHVVRSHPLVRDAAAYAIADPLSGEEVMVAIQRNGGDLDPAELHEFCRERMAHFMLPRFVRFVAELPKTETGKVLKRALRSEGITEDTWDRERAGIRVKMEKLA